MIKLNDDSMYVGQIKQILHNFNLPKCGIGNQFPAANKHFLFQNAIWRWDDNLNPVYCTPYVFGDEYLNFTGRFDIENLIYDRKTHRYLGNYLRFLRDYCNLNLMSMYNCFDQEINNEEISFKYIEHSVEKEISFTSNKHSIYACYKIPISFNNVTISTHNNTYIDACLSIKNKHPSDQKLINQFASLSYRKMKNHSATIYKTKDIIETILEEQKNSKTLCNFIKSNLFNLELLIMLPITLETSVVVLEGEYTENSKFADENFIVYKYKADNNNEHIYDVDGDEGILKRGHNNYKLNVQLLSSENATGNYLLADKLIEYLSGNAITKISEPYEIERLQKMLDSARFGNYEYSKLLIAPKTRRYYGIWDESDFINIKTLIYYWKLENDYDMLGYFDKELENKMRGNIDGVRI